MKGLGNYLSSKTNNSGFLQISVRFNQSKLSNFRLKAVSKALE